jgi:hypothetical protein
MHDWLADMPVHFEPVSERYSLLTGKNTGKTDVLRYRRPA